MSGRGTVLGVVVGGDELVDPVLVLVDAGVGELSLEVGNQVLDAGEVPLEALGRAARSSRTGRARSGLALSCLLASLCRSRRGCAGRSGGLAGGTTGGVGGRTGGEVR